MFEALKTLRDRISKKSVDDERSWLDMTFGTAGTREEKRAELELQKTHVISEAATLGLEGIANQSEHSARYIGGIPIPDNFHGLTTVECLSGGRVDIHMEDRHIRFAQEKNPHIHFVADVNQSKYGDLIEFDVNTKYADGTRDSDFSARGLMDFALEYFETKNNIRGCKALWQRQYAQGNDPNKPADTYLDYVKYKREGLKKYQSERPDSTNEEAPEAFAKRYAAFHTWDGFLKYNFTRDIQIEEKYDNNKELESITVIALKSESVPLVRSSVTSSRVLTPIRSSR